VRLFGIGWELWLSVAAGVLAAVAAGLWWWRRHPRDPEEIERKRREHLSRVGRIVEGEILEINEAPAPLNSPAGKPSANGSPRAEDRQGEPSPNSARSLVLYTYSISGVTYEAGQDITGFEQRACLSRVISGQPASVKYDPANPGNSMLIAEDWSGID
jgi:hypothetical protein